MAITLSPKYQVVIPKQIRKELNLKPKQKFQVIRKGKSIILVPVPKIEELRGMCKGLDMSNYRDEEDRL